MRNHQTTKRLKVTGGFRLLMLIPFLFILCEKGNSQGPEWPWALGFHGTGFVQSYSSSVAVSDNGDVYTTGSFGGTIDFDPGPGIFNLSSIGITDIFISKLDSAGNFVWAKLIGPIDEESPNVNISTIALDAIGNVYISSIFYLDSIDFDPGPASYYLPLNGWIDIFILKLDSAGNFIWAKAIGGDGFDAVTVIAIDGIRNRICLTGVFSGTTDFDPGPDTFALSAMASWDIFILTLDFDGNFEWAGAMGGQAEDVPYGLALNTAGNVYVAGYFREVADFDPGPALYELSAIGEQDIFVAKLEDDGNFAWAKSIGSSGWDSANGIAVEIPSGNIFITGYFTNTIDFDPGPDSFNIVAVGSADAFITKFDPEGDFVWAKTFAGSEYESGSSITVDRGGNGGMYVTGYFRGTTDFDPGPATYNLSTNGLDDLFICKLNRFGDLVWTYGAGGTSWDYSNAIVLDRYGYGYITGYIQSSSGTFGPTTIVNTCNSTSFVSKFYACNGIVSNTLDSGRGSLREVISCSFDNKFISFAIPALSQVTLTSGEIGIKRDLTLSGTPSFDISISGSNTSRIFKIFPEKNLILKGLTLKNGNAPTNGGAILTEGNLTLENMLLKNNYENGVPKALTILNQDITVNILGHVNIKY